jgi:hypothetical protein
MTTISYLDEHDGYRAGACNIGPAEIARRRRSGVAGLAAAGLLATALLVVDAAPVVRLAVAAPLFFGLLGLAQARLRFCVGFGLAGVRNFGALGAVERVAATEARRADLRRAMGVTLGVAAATAVLALAFAALPV